MDTHCHLQFNAYNKDREEVIKRCAEKKTVCNVVGTQKDTSRLAVELAEKYDFLYATIGLHPIHLFSAEVDEEETSFKSREESFDESYYDELAKSKKVIAVGECGLELFHLPKNLNSEEVLKKQKEVFVQQYNFAKKHNLPLVIHVRDAHEQMLELLRSVIARSETTKQSLGNHGIAALPAVARNDIHGVMHCYTANWKYAEQYLDFGLHLGFTGVITFPPRKTNPKADIDLREVVEKCPLDKILIETDAPSLAPQAFRGQRCEPWMVEEVAKKIAEIKGKSVDEIVRITNENAQKLFKLSPK